MPTLLLLLILLLLLLSLLLLHATPPVFFPAPLCQGTTARLLLILCMFLLLLQLLPIVSVVASAAGSHGRISAGVDRDCSALGQRLEECAGPAQQQLHHCLCRPSHHRKANN